ncbi:MAG: flippase-like domain-containing protein [Bacteroidales bacterium]|nr:flippase-like domain-containing protein [Bacteroidales bacterium]MBN2758118.1 flippase-like domain-containing protein [Bacteroidales bacterium]
MKQSKYFKNNKKHLLFLKLIIVLISYSYIAYKLLEYSNLWNKFSTEFDINTAKYNILLSAFLLMPLNWLLESTKWKILLTDIEKISIIKSLKSIFVGLSFAIITPNRIGEFVGRPVLLKKENRISASLATFVGSLSQTIITLSLGILALILFFRSSSAIFISKNQYIIFIIFSILLLILISLIFFKPKIWKYLTSKINLLKKWAYKFDFASNYKSTVLIKVLSLSLLRYFVFFSQFFLLLKFFGVEISITEAFISIALNYLFLFAIPSFALAEIGIRGSVAIFFIGIFINNDLAILISSISLWIINLALPAIIGSIYLVKRKFY